jgi:hypothetical protein
MLRKIAMLSAALLFLQSPGARAQVVIYAYTSSLAAEISLNNGYFGGHGKVTGTITFNLNNANPSQSSGSVASGDYAFQTYGGTFFGLPPVTNALVSVTALFENGITYTSGLNGHFVTQEVSGATGMGFAEYSQSATSPIQLGSYFSFSPPAGGGPAFDANGLPLPFTNTPTRPFALGTVSWINANVMALPAETQWQLDTLSIVNINGIPQLPPSVTCTANPSNLSPTGRRVATTISGTIAPGSQAITSGSYLITESKGKAQQSGAVTPNADGAFSFTVPLAAVAGREYTVTVTGTDKNANQGSCTTFVGVLQKQ